MRSLFFTKPLFLFLIPAFFCFHALQEYFGFISASDFLLLLSIYIIVSYLLYLFIRVSLKSAWKAALFVFVLQLIFFFFSSLHFWLIKISQNGLISKYIFLFPLVTIFIIVSFVVIKKTKSFPLNFFFFNNLIFSIFLFLEIVFLSAKDLNSQKKYTHIAGQDTLNISASNGKPDIYFIIFDEYASSLSIKERFNIDNTLDTFLLHKGFHIIPKSISNYNLTPFSMGSILNMAYLENVDSGFVSNAHFRIAHGAIKQSRVVSILQRAGYDFINLSPFDCQEKYSPFRVNLFLPQGTYIINKRTFFQHVFDDLSWNLIKLNPLFKGLERNHAYSPLKRDKYLLNELLKTSSVRHERPVFVYTHFNMPHRPYYFNRFGQERDALNILKEAKSQQDNYEDYLSNLLYINKEIEILVNTLFKNTGKNAVIIIAGDHGYRAKALQTHPFRNFNSIYFPDNINDQNLPDSISMVNEFPLLLNKIFNQQFPYLDDTTIYLDDVSH